MKKQLKQLIVLLVVLVLLVGGYFGLQAYNDYEAEKAALNSSEITLIDAADKEVVKYSYDYEGKTYAYEKVDGTWYYVEDHSVNLKQAQMTTMLYHFTPLVAQQKIENVTDYVQYGLDETAQTVKIATEDAEYTVYVGAYNSVTRTYYFKMEGDEAVYVTTSVINGFDDTVEDLTQEETE